MTPFHVVLITILPAVLASLAYRYFVKDRGSATKTRTVSLATPLSPGDPNLEAHRVSEFPDNWWNGSELFDLECRAIFSKQWLYLTHRSQFTKPGDYHTFQLAHFAIFLILGKDHVIRAFHNVCRHRAYTIARKKSGSSTILGCRYHGWSYNTRGQLLKAPAFEDIENFDKSRNALFEIHTHTTRQGFVFVNLNTGDIPVPNFRTADVLAKVWGISEHSAPLAQFEFDEELNWKQAVYHMESSGYAASIIPSAWLDLASKLPFLPAAITAQGARAGLDPYKLSSLHFASGGGRLWYTLSASPTSATQTTFTCNVYMNWPGGINAQADGTIQTIKEEFQALLSAAATSKLLPEPISENETGGGLQKGILDELTRHLKEERGKGREVWPASRESSASEKYNQADLLCRQLSCLKTTKSPSSDLWERLGSRNELEW